MVQQLKVVNCSSVRVKQEGIAGIIYKFARRVLQEERKTGVCTSVEAEDGDGPRRGELEDKAGEIGSNRRFDRAAHLERGARAGVVDVAVGKRLKRPNSLVVWCTNHGEHDGKEVIIGVRRIRLAKHERVEAMRRVEVRRPVEIVLRVRLARQASAGEQ
eukprot:scaffold138581_cov27-Tisochrysis_lutea.AAC.1